MTIYWSQLDWQSFATLVTGLAAVTGASIVGMRQTRISSAQTEILEHQVMLAELTVRHELFDRRFSVYQTARKFLGHIVTHASEPPRELQADFLEAISTSRMLFRSEVHLRLKEMHKRAGDLGVLQFEMNTIDRSEQHYGEGNPEREHQMLRAFNDDLVGLVDLFGSEMKLSDASFSLSRY